MHSNVDPINLSVGLKSSAEISLLEPSQSGLGAFINGRPEAVLVSMVKGMLFAIPMLE